MKKISLKGKDKYETLENYSILFLFLGSISLSIGIGLSAFQKGMPTILAMLGSFITFISIILLIFIWLAKSFKGE